MSNYGYKTHKVVTGDSVQKIAIMYGVKDWREIVYFNNLEYPYIADSVTQLPSSKIAKIGDTIFIPSYDYDTSPSTHNEITLKEMEALAYGTDLNIYSAIEDNGKAQDLSVKGELSMQNGDLRLVSGIENLKQQLNTKFCTRKGTLMLHPEWGCNVLDKVGTKGTEENLTDIMLMIREAILEDFRVVGVSDLSVTKDNNKLVVDCYITPISPYPSFQYSETITE